MKPGRPTGKSSELLSFFFERVIFMWLRKLLFFIVFILWVAGMAYVACEYNEEKLSENCCQEVYL